MSLAMTGTYGGLEGDCPEDDGFENDSLEIKGIDL